MLLPEVEKIALRTIELSEPLVDLRELGDYSHVCGLLRLRGTPVGHVSLEAKAGVVTADALREAINDGCRYDVLRVLVENLLGSPKLEPANLGGLSVAQPEGYAGDWPTVTVAVCTRDRPEDLRRCVEGLLALEYPGLDLLVVDNAPSSDESERLVRELFPSVRYVCESRPGLNWARTHAALEAHGEIIAYADDDVVVDPGWVRALARVFAEQPEVMAVTGLVVPWQLESAAQVQFEIRGGFNRGYQRQWFGANLPDGSAVATQFAGTGRFGTGANMAYRKAVFERIGWFDPALDVGTVTNGGGDLEMFFRVIKSGFLLVYEPRAVVRHRHRRDYATLRKQIANDGVGFYSYLVRCMLRFEEERPALLRTGAWWLAYWSGRRMVVGRLHRRPIMKDLAKVEFLGSFVGMRAYPRARKQARHLAGSTPMPIDDISRPRVVDGAHPDGMAVRRVELTQLEAIDDVGDYPAVRVFAFWGGEPLGSVDIPNRYCTITLFWLRTALAGGLWLPLVERLTALRGDAAVNAALGELFSCNLTTLRPSAEVRPPNASHLTASVVVATRDRPDDLRLCLRSLLEQRTSRTFEVIVVDNHPSSGLTAPIVAEFPQVKLINETKRGLSYARNRGFLSANGDVLVTTDDDVVVARDWLERLLAHFGRSEVHAATGNTLPVELESRAQQLFERYGGLGRGFQPREFGPDWFRSQKGAVPTWEIGATANAAFRRQLLKNPEVGLLDEALGAGTPTGCSEDTYLFYRILRAGHVVVYDPGALAWHRHRRSMSALRQQIFNYSKGHVAYHLQTLLNEGDTRVLQRLFSELPAWRARQLARVLRDKLRGKNDYPLTLVLLEMAGNLLGPLELWRSRLRVQRLGRTELDANAASDSAPANLGLAAQ